MTSRMTIGQMLEMLMSKKCCIKGEQGDGTPFSHPTYEDVARELHELGFQKYGNEIMINGMTGEQIQCPIFIGPAYYQRLKHMVDDKIHARAKGRMTTLTRQPAEGRSKEGGLRFGEMERDCIISHGASRILQENLHDKSDPYQIPVCGNCGAIAIYNHATVPDRPVASETCRICRDSNIIHVKLPYACKLLIQELMAMGIFPKIIVK